MPRRPVPEITIDDVLAWADAHFAGHGRWPHAHSGPLPHGPLLNWRQVDNALRYGSFGLDKGSSLAKLLSAQRGARAWPTVPPLTEEQSAASADPSRARH